MLFVLALIEFLGMGRGVCPLPLLHAYGLGSDTVLDAGHE